VGKILFLAWLARQPAGFTSVADLPKGHVSESDLDALKRQGYVAVVPDRNGGVGGYVITPEVKRLSEGGLVLAVDSSPLRRRRSSFRA